MSRLLQRVFATHFGYPEAALREFLRNLVGARLDFDVLENMREERLPPQAGWPNAVPPSAYYFLPATGYRPDAKPSLRTATGVGLNCGCPVRLAKALKVLAYLPEPQRRECLGNLRKVRTHLAAVEELLWPIFWRRVLYCSHGIKLAGNSDVDWLIVTMGGAFYLEAKHRVSDWMRLTDGSAYDPERELFLGNAAQKFPRVARRPEKEVVGVTGFAELSEQDLAQCREELLRHPHIDAVIFRPLLGSFFVCSLDQRSTKFLASLILYPGPTEMPLRYSIYFKRLDRDERVGNRNQILRPPLSGPRLHAAKIPDEPDLDLNGTEWPYRFNLREIRPSGEPVFENVPPHLN